MRLGLIGLGRIGALHAETLVALPQVSALVVTDVVPAVTAAVSDRLGVEAVDSFAKLMASGIDGVVVAAATDAHPELLVTAAVAGLPVGRAPTRAHRRDPGVAVSSERPLATTADGKGQTS